jgi:hypothetical protein
MAILETASREEATELMRGDPFRHLPARPSHTFDDGAVRRKLGDGRSATRPTYSSRL